MLFPMNEGRTLKGHKDFVSIGLDTSKKLFFLPIEKGSEFFIWWTFQDSTACSSTDREHL